MRLDLFEVAVLEPEPSDNERLLQETIRNLQIESQKRDEELERRRAAWKAPEPKVKSGYLARYAKLVSSADRGAILE